MIKEYFSSVLSAFFAAGLFGMLIPEKSATGQCVRYLIALCVVVSILLPLRPALDYLISLCYDREGLESIIDSNFAEYWDSTNKLILEQNNEIICDAIKNELKEKMSIPPHECDVVLETKTESGEIRISKVNVILCGYSMWKDANEIKSLVYSLTGADCEVIAG